MSEVKLKGLVEAHADEVLTGVHLVIWDASAKPPHLMLLVDGLYYSLDVRGSVKGEAAAPLLRAARRRRVPVLFLACEATVDAGQQAKKAFSELNQVGAGVTCLTPIRAFFEALYHQSFAKAQFVFELIPQLQALEKLQTLRSLNLSDRTEFVLPIYDQATVDARIRAVGTQVQPA